MCTYSVSQVDLDHLVVRIKEHRDEIVSAMRDGDKNAQAIIDAYSLLSRRVEQCAFALCEDALVRFLNERYA